MPNLNNEMRKPKDGWEERAAKADLKHFKVSIEVSNELLNLLTAEEKEELTNLISLVCEGAEYQAIGMYKGLVKYSGNSREEKLRYWMAHLVTEGADQMNYNMLTYNAWRLSNS